MSFHEAHRTGTIAAPVGSGTGWKKAVSSKWLHSKIILLWNFPYLGEFSPFLSRGRRRHSRIMISFIKLIKDDNDDDEEMLNGR